MITIGILVFPAISLATTETVHNMAIEYTGGSNNIRRFLPEDFRNATYKDEGKLRLPGASIKIQGPANDKYLHNVEATITIIEYLKNSIGLKEAVKSPAELLSLELYSPTEDYNIIEMSDDNLGRNEKKGNPTLGDIFSDSKYISPIFSLDEINNLTTEKRVNKIEGALGDLKEHVPEGTVDNFLYRFTRIQLLVIEVMSIFFLVYGGLVWLTAGGEDQRIENGKKIIIWAIVGVVGGLIAYVVMNILVQVFT